MTLNDSQQLKANFEGVRPGVSPIGTGHCQRAASRRPLPIVELGAPVAVDEPTAMQTFISFCKGIRRDYPVRDIRDYYGEKIAYYFIFVMHILHPIFGLPAFAFVGVGVSQRFLELQVRTN